VPDAVEIPTRKACALAAAASRFDPPGLAPRSPVRGKLTVILVGPLGGEADCQALRQLIEEQTELKALRPLAHARGAEHELGSPNGALEDLFGQWSDRLSPPPVLTLIDRLEPGAQPVSRPAKSAGMDVPGARSRSTAAHRARLRRAPAAPSRPPGPRADLHTLLVLACPPTRKRPLVHAPLAGGLASRRSPACFSVLRGGLFALVGASRVETLSGSWESVLGEVLRAPLRVYRSRAAGPSGPQPALQVSRLLRTETTRFFSAEKRDREARGTHHAHPLTVLYGRSGVGKTSLLRAGVVARFPRPATLR